MPSPCRSTSCNPRSLHVALPGGPATAVTRKVARPCSEGALARLFAYCDAQIADRRAYPRSDCVTAFVNAADPEDGRLSDDELRDGLTMLIFAAFDTTRNQLGLAMQTFLSSPDQWRQIGRAHV